MYKLEELMQWHEFDILMYLYKLLVCVVAVENGSGWGAVNLGFNVNETWWKKTESSYFLALCY